MRSVTTATTILLLLILTGPLFAQTWKVKLDDINDDDPDLDRIRAEALEFLPDGKTILTTAKFYLKGVENQNNGEVLFWNAKDGSLKTRLPGKAIYYSNRANSLACSPDGKRIAAAGSSENGGRIVDVFDVIKFKHTHTLKGEASFITGLRFSPKKRVLAVAHPNRINFWNTDTGKNVGRFIQKSEIGGVAFSPDGSFLAVATANGISFLDSRTGEELGQTAIQNPAVSFDNIVISPDGKFLAAGGMPENQRSSPIYLWELRKQPQTNKVTGSLKAKLLGHREFSYSLAFSPDSKLLASASQDHTVRLWDVQKAEPIKQINEHTDFVYDVAFSPDGKHLATLGRDSLMLWTLEELRNAK